MSNFFAISCYKDAVARQLLIVAEATDKTFQIERKQGIDGDHNPEGRCPGVAWRAIRDFGILVRHVYGHEDPRELWNIIRDGDLRDLRAALVAGYAELELG